MVRVLAGHGPRPGGRCRRCRGGSSQRCGRKEPHAKGEAPRDQSSENLSLARSRKGQEATEDGRRASLQKLCGQRKASRGRHSGPALSSGDHHPPVPPIDPSQAEAPRQRSACQATVQHEGQRPYWDGGRQRVAIGMAVDTVMMGKVWAQRQQWQGGRRGRGVPGVI